MRVTEQSLFRKMQAQGIVARSRLDKSIQQTSSGLRVEHPSDDPIAVGLIVQQRASAKRFDSLRASTEQAFDEVVQTDSALGSTNNILSRMRELAVQLSNETFSANDRKIASAEVDSLKNQLVAVLNTRVGDTFIFGGTRVDAPPFDVNGTYSGDDGTRRMEVAPGVLQQLNIRADQVFAGADGNTNVFTVLENMKNALANDNTAGLRQSLGDIDNAMEQINVARTQMGISMTTFSTAQTINRELGDSVLVSAGRFSDIDIVEAAQTLSLAQTALNATVSATAKGFEITLLGKI